MPVMMSKLALERRWIDKIFNYVCHRIHCHYTDHGEQLRLINHFFPHCLYGSLPILLGCRWSIVIRSLQHFSSYSAPHIRAISSVLEPIDSLCPLSCTGSIVLALVTILHD